MALIDLLLFVAIIAVLAVLGAGSYVLIFHKRFSFLRRPYPETGIRFSRRLGIPPRSNPETPGTAPASQPPGEPGACPGDGAGTGHDAGEVTAGGLPPAQPHPAATGECEAAGRKDVDIPWSYGDCRITALVRDPYWLFVYWETNTAKREEIARRYGRQAWEESRPVLRLYDATDLYFFDSRRFLEIGINDYADNWYIHSGQANRTYCIELGRVRPDGSYIFLARSNFVSTPRDQVSGVIDEEWLLLPEYAGMLHRRIGGAYPGPSSPGLPGPAGQASSPLTW